MSPLQSSELASTPSASPSDQPARPKNVLVIGAGITGLAAAHRLCTQSNQTRVTVLEASGRLGGIIHTVERDGFTIELGPDSFITNKPGGMNSAANSTFLNS